MTLTIATLWFNSTNMVPTKESIKLVKDFIKYVQKWKPNARLIIFTHLDMDLFERFFGTDVEIMNILKICPMHQREIFDEGNSITTMIDHGKCLIVDHLFSTCKGRCVVMDIDVIESTNSGLIHPDKYENIDLSKYPIRNNGDNQVYIFNGGDFGTHMKYKDYYVNTLGSRYANLAKNGGLRIDVKRILMASYYRTHNSDAENDYDYSEILTMLFLADYNRVFRKNLKKLSYSDYMQLLDYTNDTYAESTSLDKFYDGTDSYDQSRGMIFPFEPTKYSEGGMTPHDTAIAYILSKRKSPTLVDKAAASSEPTLVDKAAASSEPTLVDKAAAKFKFNSQSDDDSDYSYTMTKKRPKRLMSRSGSVDSNSTRPNRTDKPTVKKTEDVRRGFRSMIVQSDDDLGPSVTIRRKSRTVSAPRSETPI